MKLKNPNGKAHNATWILLAGEVNKLCIYKHKDMEKKKKKKKSLLKFMRGGTVRRVSPSIMMD